jgi:hypothetical protein
MSWSIIEHDGWVETFPEDENEFHDHNVSFIHPFLGPPRAVCSCACKPRIEEDIINDTIVNTETDGQEDDIEAAIKKAGINWKEIADKINKELEDVTYYEGTNIKLVP